MDLIEFLTPDEAPENVVATDPVPSDWVLLTEIEKENIIRASVLTQAFQCPTARALHFRMLTAILHSRQLTRTLGGCFDSTETMGDAVDAEWDRFGRIWRMSLKTFQKRLILPGRENKKIAVYNTQSKKWVWPEKPDFDFMLVIGYEQKLPTKKTRSSRQGMDVAIIPEAHIRANHRVENGQVRYQIDEDGCLEYFSLSASDVDAKWQNFVIGQRGPGSGWDPDFAQEGRAEAMWAQAFGSMQERLLAFAGQSRNQPLRTQR